MNLAELPEDVCPYPRVFVTVSGAHLYGFPSRDSDLDLRGVHLLPPEEVVGLVQGPETLTWMSQDRQTDLVTHDLLKFCRLLRKRNGYVLEQLLSPLVRETTPVHEELIALAPRLLTSHHAHHYLGFARTQWRLHEKTGELKPLLYTFRVLLTGIHLMRTGEVLCDLNELEGGPAYLPELIGLKRSAEHVAAPAGDFAPDVAALLARLEDERAASRLPEEPRDGAALHDLVVRIRLAERGD
ncbi:nucleotidyltransferase domain-containing protein [Actinocorallia populi]|uniref:nucleotidyltransferase domain-containing protein n=1 Tax=Actinocorallia populi TaxID=2079200 RepID=UPI0018E510E1|nr:nucleotidyltransferase domain-containing protein [Actinocorallia populi]